MRGQDSDLRPSGYEPDDLPTDLPRINNGVRGRSRTGPWRVARSSAPGLQGSFPSFQIPRVARHENASAHVVQTDNQSKPVLHTFALPTELPLDAEGTGIEPVTQSPQSKYPISAVLFART